MIKKAVSFRFQCVRWHFRDSRAFNFHMERKRNIISMLLNRKCPVNDTSCKHSMSQNLTILYPILNLAATMKIGTVSFYKFPVLFCDACIWSARFIIKGITCFPEDMSYVVVFGILQCCHTFIILQVQCSPCIAILSWVSVFCECSCVGKIARELHFLTICSLILHCCAIKVIICEVIVNFAVICHIASLSKCKGLQQAYMA